MTRCPECNYPLTVIRATAPGQHGGPVVGETIYGCFNCLSQWEMAFTPIAPWQRLEYAGVLDQPKGGSMQYDHLDRILAAAADQAKSGKGKERHADGEPFENQPICTISRWLKGSPAAGPLFQAIKKTRESARLDPAAAIRELYGAINYIAAGILILEEDQTR